MNNLLKILAVLAALLVALAAASRLRRTGRVSGEVSRKLIHISMGLVTLTFPWLFDSMSQILVLGGLVLTVLFAIRLHPRLRAGFGPALHDIGRTSWGDIFFPVSAALVCWISGGDPVHFGIPVLLMTLADSAATLVGIGHFVPNQNVSRHRKSTVGSASFFVVACLVTSAWLACFSGLGSWQLVSIAVLLSAITMLVERTASRGYDNLFVPLAASQLLPLYLAATPGELAVHLIGMSLLFAAALVTRQFLRPHAAATAALAAYALWAMGVTFLPHLLSG